MACLLQRSVTGECHGMEVGRSLPAKARLTGLGGQVGLKQTPVVPYEDSGELGRHWNDDEVVSLAGVSAGDRGSRESVPRASSPMMRGRGLRTVCSFGSLSTRRSCAQRDRGSGTAPVTVVLDRARAEVSRSNVTRRWTRGEIRRRRLCAPLFPRPRRAQKWCLWQAKVLLRAG